MKKPKTEQLDASWKVVHPGCEECAAARVALKVRGANRMPRYSCDTCDPRPKPPRTAEYVRGITGLTYLGKRRYTPKHIGKGY